MGRKFMAMLGTGNYSKCGYSNGKECIETRFTQEAIIKMYMKDISEEDEIVIFLTEKSKNMNWENGDNIKNGIKNTIYRLEGLTDEAKEQIDKILCNYKGYEDQVEKNGKIGLKEVLQSNFSKAKIKYVNINDGKNEQELWDTFNKILDEINDDDQIIFDITHGFRSTPMQILVVLNYAKVIKKNVKIKGIYYGAFENRDNVTNIAPIFDLSNYDEILDWTAAADSFIKYGISNQISYLCENTVTDNPKKLAPIKKFANSLKTFTSCIETSRGRIVSKSDCKNNVRRAQKSISKAYEDVNENLNNFKEDEKQSIQPLEKLLTKIEERLSEFKCDSNFDVGMSAIRWCYENNMIQHAYTALNETIKTYLCDKYGIENCKKTERDDIVKRALTNKLHEQKISKDKAEEKSKEKDEYLKQKINLIIKTVPEEIVNLSDKISKIRNDMDHFGYTEESRTYDEIQKKLKEHIDKFEEIIEKYKDVDFSSSEDDNY